MGLVAGNTERKGGSVEIWGFLHNGVGGMVVTTTHLIFNLK